MSVRRDVGLAWPGERNYGPRGDEQIGACHEFAAQVQQARLVGFRQLALGVVREFGLQPRLDDESGSIVHPMFSPCSGVRALLGGTQSLASSSRFGWSATCKIDSSKRSTCCVGKAMPAVLRN